MSENVLREQLVAQLEGGQAYLAVKRIFEDFPIECAGTRIDGIRHGNCWSTCGLRSGTSSSSRSIPAILRRRGPTNTGRRIRLRNRTTHGDRQ